MPNVKNKPKAKKPGRRDFGINSEGEITILVGDKDVSKELGLHACNLDELHQLLGRPHTQEDVDQFYEDQARRVLTPQEYDVYKKWEQFNNAVEGGGLFRFYAGLGRRYYNGRGYVVISTEFQAFTDTGDEPWKTVEAFATEFGGTVEVMDECPRLDHYSPPKGVKGERIDHETPPSEYQGKKRPWAFGPDHGRPERQVSVDVEVQDMTVDQVTLLHRSMKARILELKLNEHWVTVM